MAAAPRDVSGGDQPVTACSSDAPPVAVVTEGRLRRRLGVGDAVVVGTGSMIGAGVFTVWSPAAASAGTGLLVGLAVAASVATSNALSSAQLAARHPESGGTYVCARHELGARPGPVQSQSWRWLPSQRSTWAG